MVNNRYEPHLWYLDHQSSGQIRRSVLVSEHTMPSRTIPCHLGIYCSALFLHVLYKFHPFAPNGPLALTLGRHLVSTQLNPGLSQD
jgi:hypothetical protein